MSVTLCFTDWKLPIGRPNCSRTLTYPTVISSSRSPAPSESAAFSTAAASLSHRTWASSAGDDVRLGHPHPVERHVIPAAGLIERPPGLDPALPARQAPGVALRRWPPSPAASRPTRRPEPPSRGRRALGRRVLWPGHRPVVEPGSPYVARGEGGGQVRPAGRARPGRARSARCRGDRPGAAARPISSATRHSSTTPWPGAVVAPRVRPGRSTRAPPRAATAFRPYRCPPPPATHQLRAGGSPRAGRGTPRAARPVPRSVRSPPGLHGSWYAWSGPFTRGARSRPRAARPGCRREAPEAPPRGPGSAAAPRRCPGWSPHLAGSGSPPRGGPRCGRGLDLVHHPAAHPGGVADVVELAVLAAQPQQPAVVAHPVGERVGEPGLPHPAVVVVHRDAELLGPLRVPVQPLRSVGDVPRVRRVQPGRLPADLAGDGERARRRRAASPSPRCHTIRSVTTSGPLTRGWISSPISTSSKYLGCGPRRVSAS